MEGGPVGVGSWPVAAKAAAAAAMHELGRWSRCSSTAHGASAAAACTKHRLNAARCAIPAMHKRPVPRPHCCLAPGVEPAQRGADHSRPHHHGARGQGGRPGRVDSYQGADEQACLRCALPGPATPLIKGAPQQLHCMARLQWRRCVLNPQMPAKVVRLPNSHPCPLYCRPCTA